VTDLFDESGPDLRIEISPMPTEDERDALVAALATVLTAATLVAPDVTDQTPPSRWAHAGRDAALAARDLRARRSR